MIDLSRPISLDHIPPTTKPRIIVGNKSDISVITATQRAQIKSMGYEYFETSLKSEGCTHYIKPLGYLMQKLIGDDFKFPATYLTDKR